MLFVDSNMCQFDMRHPVTKELVWKCLRLLTNAPWLMSLGRLCTEDHKHTRLEGRWTKWSAACALTWCKEYARLSSRAPEFLKMLTTYKPVASTDNSFKHVSVSMLRHWPEYPSYYLTGDLETARQTSVCVSPPVENRLAPVFGDAGDSVPETGPGHAGGSSSSGSGCRAGDVFIEEEEPGEATGSGTGMIEA